MANVASPAAEFSLRARLYDRLDRQLGSKTRFFAAARATNHVLGRLTAYRGVLLFPSECADWLSTLGRLLESANLQMAQALQTGQLTEHSLDRYIVSREQGLVEDALSRIRGVNAPSYYCLTRQVDSLLNSRIWRSLGAVMPLVGWYGRVVVEVRGELGAPIQFALKSHRICIGLGLIRSLWSAPTG